MMLNLPVELLQQIANESQTPWLRAVCRHLRMIIDPLFFSVNTVVLNMRSCEPGKYSGISYLEALAHGSTGWSQYATTLEVRDDVGLVTNAFRDEIELFLRPALESLRHNIRTVIWQQKTIHFHRTLKSILVEFLDSLVTLDELRLIYVDTADEPIMKLPLLSNVGTLKITALGNEAAPLVRPITGVVMRSRSLSSLHLRGLEDWSDVWNTLKEQQICLRELEASGGGIDPLLAYLGSYAGLTHLSLFGVGYRADAAKADHFFNHVLQLHAASLQALSCHAGREGPWCFGTHNADAVGALQNLLILEISIQLGDITEPSTPSRKNAVELFIQTSTRLSVLRRLWLTAASPADGNGNNDAPETRRRIVVHHQLVRDQIVAITSNYHYTGESPAVVQWIQNAP
ncbi:hypothetical protein B0H19DRAFT_1240749 [Mycena capillaripes]|nr:hypothetical protein B0H19DRAFT_1240749 [Mycena capillaripes]